MTTKAKLLLSTILFLGILLFGVQVVQAASLAKKSQLSYTTSKSDCIENNGVWDGEESIWFGTCTYAPGTSAHEAHGCTANQNLVVTFTWPKTTLQAQQNLRFSRNIPKPATGIIIVTTSECVNIHQSGYGACGAELNGVSEKSTIYTCGTEPVSVTFDAETCLGKCTISPSVLNGVEKKLRLLDGDIIGEVYIKTRGSYSSLTSGTYRVCFTGEGTVYRWVSGGWRALSTSTAGGISCASGNGDGNYVLVK